MIDPLFYWSLAGACSIYAFWAGGAPERIGAAILLIGSALSYAAGTLGGLAFERFEIGTFLVDLAVLAAFGVLALKADRYWPLGVTGLHLVGVASHMAELASSQVIAWAYSIGQSLWGYPIILLIAWGTARHRTRLRAHGNDRSWSDSSAPSEGTPTGGLTL